MSISVPGDLIGMQMSLYSKIFRETSYSAQKKGVMEDYCVVSLLKRLSEVFFSFIQIQPIQPIFTRSPPFFPSNGLPWPAPPWPRLPAAAHPYSRKIASCMCMCV